MFSPPSSLKRKRSALGDTESVADSGVSLSKKPRSSPGSVLLNGIKKALDHVGSSLTTIAVERTARQASVRRQTLLERRLAAACLQEREGHLVPEHMIALLDLISNDSRAADIYMTLSRKDYRDAWTSKRLAELGYPPLQSRESVIE